MAIIQVENPVINKSSFDPNNRKDGISGVMLIHNEEEFLAQVIETWIDAVDELVIVFNDCTDNSPQIIEEYERKYYPKIRAFHYLQRVYSPNTKEQLELDVNNINSFTFYSNFNLSKTRYKICVEISGDHVGIPEYLKKIYHYLKRKPLQNSALFFSGINLSRKHPDDIQYYIDLKDSFIGDGDLAYWTVSPENIFVKHPKEPLFTIVKYAGLTSGYYLGFIFWHTRNLKKDYGQGNYGQYSTDKNTFTFLDSALEEAKLVPLSPQFKQKNKDFQNVSLPRFPLYFDFGSLPEVAGVDRATEILQQAIQYYQANRFTEAEQAYRQVLDIQPERSEALYKLGILAQQMGNLQTAEEFWSRLLQLEPNSLKTWFSLANLHQSQGQFTAAVEAYRQALKLRPDSAPIYNNLGYTLEKLGNLEEAIASYQKALELQPDCTEADVNWGNALHTQGKLSKDKQLHYAQLNYNLGVVREQAGDLQNAVAYYQQAINLQPDFVEAHYHLGMALQAQGNLEEAIASYQKVLEFNPNYIEVYKNLGKIYQGQGNLKEATAAYRQGLKLINPHYAAAVKTEQVSKTIGDEHTPPQLPQEEVTVGGHSFPAIPPVLENGKKRPFWSVAIAVHNRTDYLLESLTSVLAQWQGEEEMEIIVMDNASTPPLFELVNALGNGIIRYYRHPQNIGRQRNYNAGIALSRGRWIHLLHDDDYVLPGFYSRLKQSLEGCSESIGAAFTGYENINDQGKVVGTGEVVSLYGEYRGIPQDWLQQIGVSCPVDVPAVVIRRTTHERLGGYDPNLEIDDWEMYKRIASFYDWWCEPEILAHFRWHSDKVTVKNWRSGNLATAIRHAIEISEGYLPQEYCAEITAKARSHRFHDCLTHAVIPLKAGNLAGAFQIIQEALKIDRSPEAVAKLFAWLTEEEAAPLREEIISRLLSIPGDNYESGINTETKQEQTTIKA